jgi:hypothetical protein
MREGNKLVAAEPTSLEAIQGLKVGETLTATIRRPRNGSHHRKLFALLSVVMEAQTTFATTQELLNALKMATGLFEIGRTVDGIPFAQAQSISFVSMAQDRFEQFYDKAVDVILTKILPGVGRTDLEQRVNDILLGRGAP